MDQALYDNPRAYDALYRWKEYEEEVEFVLDRFERRGNGGDTALIVGCGTGNHSVYLRDRGFDVTGVDPNPAMLERERARADATFRRGALPDFDVEGEYDLVWAPYTIVGYLAADELAPALDALAARLADGGALVFDTGDFPDMPAPMLETVSDGVDCARLAQFRRVGDRRVRMDAVIFVGERWFIDGHVLTDFADETVVEALTERGFEVTTHDWYGTPMTMDEPTVFVASKE